MQMIDLRLDPRRLLHFAYAQGHRADDDFGYALHAWFAAALGNLAPKPFRCLETRNGDLRVLGYGDADVATLSDHVASFTEPEAAAVCDWYRSASKTMPTEWQSGRRLGFEVRACPVSRGERERDIYLVSVEQSKAQGIEPLPRAEVYRQWLEKRFGEVVNPQRISLTGMRRVRTYRLHRSRGTVSSGGRTVERPDALFSGELTVVDPEGFNKLLARGIGRHRAFGFGMLLLRPPGGVAGG